MKRLAIVRFIGETFRLAGFRVAVSTLAIVLELSTVCLALDNARDLGSNDIKIDMRP